MGVSSLACLQELAASPFAALGAEASGAENGQRCECEVTAYEGRVGEYYNMMWYGGVKSKQGEPRRMRKKCRPSRTPSSGDLDHSSSPATRARETRGSAAGRTRDGRKKARTHYLTLNPAKWEKVDRSVPTKLSPLARIAPSNMVGYQPPNLSLVSASS